MACRNFINVPDDQVPEFVRLARERNRAIWHADREREKREQELERSVEAPPQSLEK